MVDRRFLFFCAVLLAFGLLALVGLTPVVLWGKAQDLVYGATGAASAVRSQSQKRENRSQEVGEVLDGLPGNAEKKSPRRRHDP